MHLMFDALRTRLGPPPRTMDRGLESAFALAERPGWLKPTDNLALTWARHEDVLRDGRLMLGVIYVANSALWSASAPVAPGGVIFTSDRALERALGALEGAADRMFGIGYGAQRKPPPLQSDPWLRFTQDLARAELARPMNARVPPDIARGHVMFHSALMVFPASLPHGYLTGRVVPLLVLEGAPPLLVPSTLWPPELLRLWQPA
jgi:hypothetical protein